MGSLSKYLSADLNDVTIGFFVFFWRAFWCCHMFFVKMAPFGVGVKTFGCIWCMTVYWSLVYTCTSTLCTVRLVCTIHEDIIRK